MVDFVIPKNEDFSFKLKILKKDSTDIQELTYLSSFELKIYDAATNVTAITVTKSNADIPVSDRLEGIVEVNLTALQTNTLTVKKGDPADGHYLIAGYQGSIKLEFVAGSNILPIYTNIEKIYVSQTGN